MALDCETRNRIRTLLDRLDSIDIVCADVLDPDVPEDEDIRRRLREIHEQIADEIASVVCPEGESGSPAPG